MKLKLTKLVLPILILPILILPILILPIFVLPISLISAFKRPVLLLPVFLLTTLLIPSKLVSQPGNHISTALIQNTLLLSKVNSHIKNQANNNILDINNSALGIKYHNPTELNINFIDKPASSKTAYFSDEKLSQLRKLFIQAETAIKKGNDKKYFKLAQQLKKYPLYPMLQYQWLIKNLNEEIQVKRFLKYQSTSRYASKLKYRWLFYLAKHEKWSLFLQYYVASNNKELVCYRHRAQYESGYQKTALDGAKNLWVVGYSQPRACNTLFSVLKKTNLITQDMVWKRFDASLKNNKVKLAHYLKSLLPRSEKAAARLWLKLHHHPSRYIQQLLKQEQNPQSAFMFAHAINRMISKNHNSAIKLWDANKQDFALNRQVTDGIEKRLAFKLVFKQEAGAYARLSLLNTPDESSREWRVRVALSEQNWENVQAAINALDYEEKRTEKWQYWSARAQLEMGNSDIAEKIFSVLATKRDFYGFMAADKINSMYQLSDNPVNVSRQDIEHLKNHKEFRVAFELKQLNRITQAKLQWWHALRTLSKSEIMAAAKLAQQWQWQEIAIFTIAKVKHWDDVEMRFPINYADKIHENSVKQALNPAILFGLIRRESAFNEKARSPSGARGLMQIMPSTGKQIARDFNERWRGNNSLFNPVTNLRYGSYYYQKLLKKFDGNYALALAAYNAGPNRVKRWAPKTGSVPADIWIETIPYHETREYVSAVLTYALIYQQRIQSSGLSMSEFTQEIRPL